MIDPDSSFGPHGDRDVQGLAEEYLATASLVDRARFADTHPEVRDLEVITRIMVDMTQASVEGDAAKAELLGASAMLLAGTADPEGPGLISWLFRARLAFEAAQTDLSSETAVAIERARKAARLSETCHPLIRGPLLDTASVVLAFAARSMNSSELLGEAVTMARRAVHATTSSARERNDFIRNLTARLVELSAATGDRSHLDEAIRLEGDEVDAAAATSTELPSLLSGLAGYLAERYETTAKADPLEGAFEPAPRSSTSAASAERGRSVASLASPSPGLAEAPEDLADIADAVAAARQAVAATSTDSSERAIALNDLAFYLSELYNASGDRSVLDESTRLLREAVRATTTSEAEWIGIMHNLSVSLWDQFKATDDPAHLIEAILLAQQAVGATPETSNELPRRLSNLSSCLRDLYTISQDRALLAAAVEFARQAVGTVSPTLFQLLHNLGNRLGDLWEATGSQTDLDEAIEVAREAMNAIPDKSRERPLALTKLARYLAEKYRATNERIYLQEALDLVPLSRGRGPADRVLLSRTRADLARLDDDVSAAIAAVKDASAAFAAERDRLRGDPIGLRGLAGQTEGLVGDTAACLVLAGQQDDALEVVEGARTWLPAAPPATSQLPVPVVWVVTSTWETVVLSTHLEEPVVLDIDRHTIADRLNRTFRGLRGGEPQEAVEELCEFTTQITAVFPPVSEVLIVPVGACALLPYAAGRTAKGDHLIDQTAVTLAPSLGWAQAASRARPSGASLGVFHPGQPRLNLVGDRLVFQAAFPGATTLDSPHAAEVLPLLGTDNAVAHFSCHGRYNVMQPWLSALALADDLTLQSILDHQKSNWLVNLSACETGIPYLGLAEQSISFPTGFLSGGTSHVIATLWPVGNDHATEYNRRFYQLLQEGQRPALAHQKAINDLRGLNISHDRLRAVTVDFGTNLEFDHPYRWAAFTHHGSPR